MDNQSLSLTKWKCQYHIVFIPKYWKKQLYGQIKADVLRFAQISELIFLRGLNSYNRVCETLEGVASLPIFLVPNCNKKIGDWMI